MFLGDESTKVILTPDGSADDVSDDLADFLCYLAGKGGDSPFVRRLDAAVDRAREKEEWRVEYMTLFMRDREKFEEGKAEGMAEGIQKERLDAIQKMIRKGYSRDFVLDLDYTESEYTEAEAGLLQKA